MTQPIPLTNPRRVVVPLKDYGKKAGAYKLWNLAKPHLIPRGWQVVKETREYVYMTPPAGETKPFSVTLDVPDRAQVEKLAAERHAVGEQWVGKVGEWPAFYIPAKAETWLNYEPINPDTGERTDNESYTVNHPARFHVGTIQLWTVWVAFGEAGPVYYDPKADPEPATVLPDLFASIPDADQHDDDNGDDPAELAFPEGRELVQLHRGHERNPKVIRLAKEHAKRTTGRLACEGCGFDFAAKYGPRGEDFIEGHHTRPLSDPDRGTETPVADIALVCANCHRMIHRRWPWLTMDELIALINQPTDCP